MNIVVLDGGTTNPGDLSGPLWRPWVPSPSTPTPRRSWCWTGPARPGRHRQPGAPHPGDDRRPARACLHRHPVHRRQPGGRRRRPGAWHPPVQRALLLCGHRGPARPLPAAVPVRPGPRLQRHSARGRLGRCRDHEPHHPPHGGALRENPGHPGLRPHRGENGRVRPGPGHGGPGVQPHEKRGPRLPVGLPGGAVRWRATCSPSTAP